MLLTFGMVIINTIEVTDERSSVNNITIVDRQLLQNLIYNKVQS